MNDSYMASYISFKICSRSVGHEFNSFTLSLYCSVVMSPFTFFCRSLISSPPNHLLKKHLYAFLNGACACVSFICFLPVPFAGINIRDLNLSAPGINCNIASSVSFVRLTGQQSREYMTGLSFAS